jgi:hypothetical protein
MKDLKDLESRAKRLYPNSKHLQRGWLRGVAMARQSPHGWRGETIQKQGTAAHG